VPLYHSHGSASKQFITGAGAAAEGVRLPAAALLVASQLPGGDPQKAPSMAYTKAYMDRYHDDVSTFGGHAYDALMLLVEAIKRAGSTDPAKVRDALESTRNFVGLDGIFNMSPTDHGGLDSASFKMVEVHNSDWKYLY
jgi:branched-chain amino acid transport system substrate-binding protein